MHLFSTNFINSSIARLATRYAGDYLERIEPDKFEIAWRSGNLALNDVNIRKSVVDLLRLPVALVYGRIGHVKVQVPLSSLFTLRGVGSPVVVSLEDLYIILRPTHDWTDEVFETQFRVARQRLLDDAGVRLLAEQAKQQLKEKAASQKPGWLASYAARLVENVQFRVRNVHIRLEQPNGFDSFCLGICLAYVEVNTPGKNEREKIFVGRDARRKALRALAAPDTNGGAAAIFKDGAAAASILDQVNSTVADGEEPSKDSSDDIAHLSQAKTLRISSFGVYWNSQLDEKLLIGSYENTKGGRATEVTGSTAAKIIATEANSAKTNKQKAVSNMDTDVGTVISSVADTAIREKMASLIQEAVHVSAPYDDPLAAPKKGSVQWLLQPISCHVALVAMTMERKGIARSKFQLSWGYVPRYCRQTYVFEDLFATTEEQKLLSLRSSEEDSAAAQESQSRSQITTSLPSMIGGQALDLDLLKRLNLNPPAFNKLSVNEAGLSNAQREAEEKATASFTDELTLYSISCDLANIQLTLTESLIKNALLLNTTFQAFETRAADVGRRLEHCKPFRPNVGVIGNAPMWWRFAFGCIVRRLRTVHPERFLLRRSAFQDFGDALRRARLEQWRKAYSDVLREEWRLTHLPDKEAVAALNSAEFRDHLRRIQDLLPTRLLLDVFIQTRRELMGLRVPRQTSSQSRFSSSPKSGKKDLTLIPFGVPPNADPDAEEAGNFYDCDDLDGTEVVPQIRDASLKRPSGGGNFMASETQGEEEEFSFDVTTAVAALFDVEIMLSLKGLGIQMELTETNIAVNSQPQESRGRLSTNILLGTIDTIQVGLRKTFDTGYTIQGAVKALQVKFVAEHNSSGGTTNEKSTFDLIVPESTSTSFLRLHMALSKDTIAGCPLVVARIEKLTIAYLPDVLNAAVVVLQRMNRFPGGRMPKLEPTLNEKSGDGNLVPPFMPQSNAGQGMEQENKVGLPFLDVSIAAPQVFLPTQSIQFIDRCKGHYEDGLFLRANFGALKIRTEKVLAPPFTEHPYDKSRRVVPVESHVFVVDFRDLSLDVTPAQKRLSSQRVKQKNGAAPSPLARMSFDMLFAISTVEEVWKQQDPGMLPRSPPSFSNVQLSGSRLWSYSIPHLFQPETSEQQQSLGKIDSQVHHELTESQRPRTIVSMTAVIPIAKLSLDQSTFLALLAAINVLSAGLRQAAAGPQDFISSGYNSVHGGVSTNFAEHGRVRSNLISMDEDPAFDQALDAAGSTIGAAAAPLPFKGESDSSITMLCHGLSRGENNNRSGDNNTPARRASKRFLAVVEKALTGVRFAESCEVWPATFLGRFFMDDLNIAVGCLARDDGFDGPWNEDNKFLDLRTGRIGVLVCVRSGLTQVAFNMELLELARRIAPDKDNNSPSLKYLVSTPAIPTIDSGPAVVNGPLRTRAGQASELSAVSVSPQSFDGGGAAVDPTFDKDFSYTKSDDLSESLLPQQRTLLRNLEDSIIQDAAFIKIEVALTTINMGPLLNNTEDVPPLRIRVQVLRHLNIVFHPSPLRSFVLFWQRTDQSSLLSDKRGGNESSSSSSEKNPQIPAAMPPPVSPAARSIRSIGSKDSAAACDVFVHPLLRDQDFATLLVEVQVKGVHCFCVDDRNSSIFAEATLTSAESRLIRRTYGNDVTVKLEDLSVVDRSRNDINNTKDPNNKNDITRETELGYTNQIRFLGVQKHVSSEANGRSSSETPLHRHIVELTCLTTSKEAPYFDGHSLVLQGHINPMRFEFYLSKLLRLSTWTLDSMLLGTILASPQPMIMSEKSADANKACPQELKVNVTNGENLWEEAWNLRKIATWDPPTVLEEKDNCDTEPSPEESVLPPHPAKSDVSSGVSLLQRLLRAANTCEPHVATDASGEQLIALRKIYLTVDKPQIVVPANLDCSRSTLIDVGNVVVSSSWRLNQRYGLLDVISVDVKGVNIREGGMNGTEIETDHPAFGNSSDYTTTSNEAKKMRFPHRSHTNIVSDMDMNLQYLRSMIESTIPRPPTWLKFHLTDRPWFLTPARLGLFLETIQANFAADDPDVQRAATGLPKTDASTLLDPHESGVTPNDNKKDVGMVPEDKYTSETGTGKDTTYARVTAAVSEGADIVTGKDSEELLFGHPLVPKSVEHVTDPASKMMLLFQFVIDGVCVFLSPDDEGGRKVPSGSRRTAENTPQFAPLFFHGSRLQAEVNKTSAEIQSIFLAASELRLLHCAVPITPHRVVLSASKERILPTLLRELGVIRDAVQQGSAVIPTGIRNLLAATSNGSELGSSHFNSLGAASTDLELRNPSAAIQNKNESSLPEYGETTIVENELKVDPTTDDFALLVTMRAPIKRVVIRVNDPRVMLAPGVIQDMLLCGQEISKEASRVAKTVAAASNQSNSSRHDNFAPLEDVETYKKLLREEGVPLAPSVIRCESLLMNASILLPKGEAFVAVRGTYLGGYVQMQVPARIQRLSDDLDDQMGSGGISLLQPTSRSSDSALSPLKADSNKMDVFTGDEFRCDSLEAFTTSPEVFTHVKKEFSQRLTVLDAEVFACDVPSIDAVEQKARGEIFTKAPQAGGAPHTGPAPPYCFATAFFCSEKKINNWGRRRRVVEIMEAATRHLDLKTAMLQSEEPDPDLELITARTRLFCTNFACTLRHKVKECWRVQLPKGSMNVPQLALLIPETKITRLQTIAADVEKIGLQTSFKDIGFLKQIVDEQLAGPGVPSSERHEATPEMPVATAPPLSSNKDVDSLSVLRSMNLLLHQMDVLIVDESPELLNLPLMQASLKDVVCNAKDSGEVVGRGLSDATRSRREMWDPRIQRQLVIDVCINFGIAVRFYNARALAFEPLLESTSLALRWMTYGPYSPTDVICRSDTAGKIVSNNQSKGTHVNDEASLYQRLELINMNDKTPVLFNLTPQFVGLAIRNISSLQNIWQEDPARNSVKSNESIHAPFIEGNTQRRVNDSFQFSPYVVENNTGLFIAVETVLSNRTLVRNVRSFRHGLMSGKPSSNGATARTQEALTRKKTIRDDGNFSIEVLAPGAGRGLWALEPGGASATDVGSATNQKRTISTLKIGIFHDSTTATALEIDEGANGTGNKIGQKEPNRDAISESPITLGAADISKEPKIYELDTHIRTDRIGITKCRVVAPQNSSLSGRPVICIGRVENGQKRISLESEVVIINELGCSNIALEIDILSEPLAESNTSGRPKRTMVAPPLGGRCFVPIDACRDGYLRFRPRLLTNRDDPRGALVFQSTVSVVSLAAAWRYVEVIRSEEILESKENGSTTASGLFFPRSGIPRRIPPQPLVAIVTHVPRKSRKTDAGFESLGSEAAAAMTEWSQLNLKDNFHFTVCIDHINMAQSPYPGANAGISSSLSVKAPDQPLKFNIFNEGLHQLTLRVAPPIILKNCLPLNIDFEMKSFKNPENRAPAVLSEGKSYDGASGKTGLEMRHEPATAARSSAQSSVPDEVTVPTTSSDEQFVIASGKLPAGGVFKLFNLPLWENISLRINSEFEMFPSAVQLVTRHLLPPLSNATLDFAEAKRHLRRCMDTGLRHNGSPTAIKHYMPFKLRRIRRVAGADTTTAQLPMPDTLLLACNAGLPGRTPSLILYAPVWITSYLPVSLTTRLAISYDPSAAEKSLSSAGLRDIEFRDKDQKTAARWDNDATKSRGGNLNVQGIGLFHRRQPPREFSPPSSHHRTPLDDKLNSADIQVGAGYGYIAPLDCRARSLLFTSVTDGSKKGITVERSDLENEVLLRKLVSGTPVAKDESRVVQFRAMHYSTGADNPGNQEISSFGYANVVFRARTAAAAARLSRPVKIVTVAFQWILVNESPTFTLILQQNISASAAGIDGKGASRNSATAIPGVGAGALAFGFAPLSPTPTVILPPKKFAALLEPLEYRLGILKRPNESTTEVRGAATAAMAQQFMTGVISLKHLEEDGGSSTATFAASRDHILIVTYEAAWTDAPVGTSFIRVNCLERNTENSDRATLPLGPATIFRNDTDWALLSWQDSTPMSHATLIPPGECRIFAWYTNLSPQRVLLKPEIEHYKNPIGFDLLALKRGGLAKLNFKDVGEAYNLYIVRDNFKTGHEARNVLHKRFTIGRIGRSKINYKLNSDGIFGSSFLTASSKRDFVSRSRHLNIGGAEQSPVPLSRSAAISFKNSNTSTSFEASKFANSPHVQLKGTVFQPTPGCYASTPTSFLLNESVNPFGPSGATFDVIIDFKSGIALSIIADLIPSRNDDEDSQMDGSGVGGFCENQGQSTLSSERSSIISDIFGGRVEFERRKRARRESLDNEAAVNPQITTEFVVLTFTGVKLRFLRGVDKDLMVAFTTGAIQVDYLRPGASFPIALERLPESTSTTVRRAEKARLQKGLKVPLADNLGTQPMVDILAKFGAGFTLESPNPSEIRFEILRILLMGLLIRVDLDFILDSMAVATQFQQILSENATVTTSLSLPSVNRGGVASDLWPMSVWSSDILEQISDRNETVKSANSMGFGIEKKETRTYLQLLPYDSTYEWNLKTKRSANDLSRRLNLASPASSSISDDQSGTPVRLLLSRLLLEDFVSNQHKSDVLEERRQGQMLLLSLMQPREEWVDDTELNLSPTLSLPSAGDAQKAADTAHLYFDELLVGALLSRVSFSPACSQDVPFAGVGVRDQFLRFILTLGSVHDAALTLSALEIRDQVVTPFILIQRMKAAYLPELRQQALLIAGNADVLGNPVDALANLTAGFGDLLLDPYEGFQEDAMLQGIGKGVSSLVNHTLYGTFNAVSKVSGTAAQGLNFLSLDKRYARRKQQELNRAEAPRDVAQGLTQGAEAIGRGFLGGFSTLINEPTRGFAEASERGVSSVFEGIGKGVIGALMKPAAGAFEAASLAAKGFRNSAGGQPRQNTGIRSRQLRMFFGRDRRFEEYNPTLAALNERLMELPGLQWSDMRIERIFIDRPQLSVAENRPQSLSLDPYLSFQENASSSRAGTNPCLFFALSEDEFVVVSGGNGRMRIAFWTPLISIQSCYAAEEINSSPRRNPYRAAIVIGLRANNYTRRIAVSNLTLAEDIARAINEGCEKLG